MRSSAIMTILCRKWVKQKNPPFKIVNAKICGLSAECYCWNSVCPQNSLNPLESLVNELAEFVLAEFEVLLVRHFVRYGIGLKSPHP